MWGYASRHDALSEGVLDPLYATALVLQVGDNTMAVVNLDLGRVPGEGSLARIRGRIKNSLGIKYSFIAASHTHHGPVLELSDEKGKGRGRFDASIRYYRRLEDAIVQAVTNAQANVRPAKMAVGKTNLSDFNFNRQTDFKPEPRDNELGIMRFDDRLSGKPLVLLINFAAHPTLVPDTVTKFSADYPGIARLVVEKETGARMLFIQGACGDLAPQGEDYQSYGTNLAMAVVHLSSQLQTMEPVHPSLRVKQGVFNFPSRINLKQSSVRAPLEQAFFPELIANYADEFEKGVHPEISVAVLNDEIAFVGASGEFFCSHCTRLKERARVKQLFFCGYCNGYQGYFPTIEAMAEGGYGTEGISAPAAAGSGERLMNTALVWLYSMLSESRMNGGN